MIRGGVATTVAPAGMLVVTTTFGPMWAPSPIETLPMITAPIPIEIGSFPRIFPRIRGRSQSFGTHGYTNATGLWLEAQIEPFSGLLVVPGVRSEFIRVGFLPDTLPGGIKTDSAEVELTSIDPRLSTSLQLLRGTTVKGAIGTYRQPPNPQTLTPEGGMYSRFTESGIRLIVLDVRRSPVRHLLRLCRLIRALRPDIVQTWLYHADLLGGLAGPDARLDVTGPQGAVHRLLLLRRPGLVRFSGASLPRLYPRGRCDRRAEHPAPGP